MYYISFREDWDSLVFSTRKQFYFETFEDAEKYLFKKRFYKHDFKNIYVLEHGYSVFIASIVKIEKYPSQKP